MQVLVLAWAENRKDLEVVWKLLSQLSLAFRGDGGRTIVVLSRREKLVSAAVFDAAIFSPSPPQMETSATYRGDGGSSIVVLGQSDKLVSSNCTRILGCADVP